MSQNNFNYILDWSKKYKLEYNTFKRKVLKIYKKSIIDQRINLNLEGETIEELRKTKYLGIIVDQNMQWNKHISYVSSKSKKILNALFRISNNTFGVWTNVLQLIYKQGILPLIFYASRAWGHSLKKKIKCRLHRKIQRKFLRVIKGYRTIS